MHFQEILSKKRDRKPLGKEEIYYFVESYTKDNIPDYQASAFLMASFINGLSIDETVWLTEAMLHSGTVVDLSEIPGTKVDKHSTGGVGDKTSLVIASICATLGVPVPMISGRGLGHTGGTLDKLESIPGFKVNLGLDQYRKLIGEVGTCLIGQTKEIAPADKKMYALRDVTCTVENKSLISASIMSKKLAEGIDGLVLDVKVGSGAFMKTETKAEELARLMMSIGKKMNKRVTALITDMNQTLGSYVGNSLEVIESAEILKGNILPEQQDLFQLCLLLSAHMILLGGKAENLDLALEMARQSINSGSALQKFKEIIEKQGGDSACLNDYEKLPTAGKSHPVKAEVNGYLKSLDALMIGKGAVYLGAGRLTLESKIDPGVGIIVKKKVGDQIHKGETILEIKYNSKEKLNDCLSYVNQAISIVDEPVSPLQLVKKTITDSE